MRNILIVDDDLVQAKFFGKFISQMNHNVIYIDKGQEAVDFFISKKPVSGILPHQLDVMLLDILMPDISGLEVLRQIAKFKDDVQIIVLTSGNEISMVVKAVSLGAIDYIVKGEKDIFARISTSVNNSIEKRNLKYQISFSERTDGGQVMFSDLIGNSPPFIEATNLARKTNTNSAASVLIEGEAGTGKEFLAKAIHGSSVRAEMPFIAVDCAKLNNENADDVLFGYKRILENGKEEKRLGKIKKANNGTLFLDNIDALSIDSQIKLLYFIQEREITPTGCKPVTGVNVRIISATTYNLRILSKKNRFKEDLYYCLSVFMIKMPNLRERGYEDIKALAKYFCYNFNISENKRIKGITEEAFKLLAKLNWERNIRQLKNYIFRAVVLCDDKYLEPKHFPKISDSGNEELTNDLNRQYLSDFFDYDCKSIDLFDSNGKCKTWSRIGQEVVRQLFDAYGGNLSEISKNLKVSRSTIYRKLNNSKQ